MELLSLSKKEQQEGFLQISNVHKWSFSRSFLERYHWHLQLADGYAGLEPTSAAPSPLTGVGFQQERKDRCFPMADSRYLPREGLLCGELATPLALI